ncbi:MAG: GAF domain-containing protein [Chloroflexia bacterium]|nr:GAF domain-containing protein [Chloroflexia bacterium]
MAKKDAQRQELALKVICNIGRAVAVELDLPHLIELIYEQAGQVMDTDCFAMGLYDPIEDGLRFELLYDRGERLEPMLLHREDGWGLAGRVFEGQTPLLFEDLEKSDLPDGAILLGDIPRSWLGVPLIARDRTIGVMSVQSYEPQAFDSDDHRLLEAITSQAAVAIENLYLRREHERRIEELASLSEIGQAIIAATDLDELLEIVYQETSRVMDTSNLYIALYHPQEQEISFDYFVQDGERIYAEPSSIEESGLTAYIVKKRQPLLLTEDLRKKMAERGIQLVGRPAESYLGVPMLAGDTMVGVLSVQHPEKPRFFDNRHLNLLSHIANLTAVAIENTRLFHERARRVTEQEILTEMGRVLSSSIELSGLLEVVHQQVGRLFDTTNFYIAMYDESTDEWWMGLQVEHGERQQGGDRRKVQAGLTGYIIRNRLPILFTNEAENTAFHESQGIATIGERALSWLGVPLISAGKIVGVIAIQSYKEEYLYDEQDLALFSTIAAQTAIAVDNARLFQEWKERLADLSVLNDVSQSILSAESENDLLEAIYQQVNRVMDATNFYVALYNEDEQAIDFGYFVEKGQRVDGPGRYLLSEGSVTVHIVQNREPLFLVENMDGRLSELGIEGKGRPAKSYVGVPMIVADQVIGAMAVQSYEREHAYASRHLDLLTNIATQAATAVQRIRLRSSEARKARQLSIIGEVSRKVTAVLDLNELLLELARSIQLGFGYSNVAVMRVDEEGQELELGALVGRYAGIKEWGYRQSIKEGLIGLAAREGKTIRSNNVLEDPRYVRGFDAEEIARSELCVPISYAGRVIGVLDIQSEQVEAFDPEDVAAMETLAGQLATAMRNAILFRERGQQLANLNALNRVVQSTAAALNIEELIRGLCDVVTELMSPDGFFVAIPDRDGEHLVAPLVMDEGVFYYNHRLTVGQGFTAYLVEQGEAVLIRNMVEEGDNYPVERTVMGSGKHAASWLGVPLLSGDEAIGAIVVQSYRPYAFDEEDMNFLQSVATQIVVNIERTRLFDETQRALDELRESSERQRQLLDMVRELSTPLVPITDQVLVLPLVGTIDSERAQQIMDVLLEGITKRRARVVILDITGVPVVDTSVANYILQATQAVGLLGAECILVGITPEVAQTVVGLGVDLRQLTTRSDLQGGVEYALRLLGQSISKTKSAKSKNKPKDQDLKARTPKPARPAL